MTEQTQSDFPAPTRAAAHAQLALFVPVAGEAYADRRNYDLGVNGHDGVSRLSVWLRHRLISEQEIVAAVLAVHSERSAEKFIQEAADYHNNAAGQHRIVNES